MDEFDLVVVGAGPGGYVAALEAAKHGLKTALVESRQLGGTCLHRGCIPTKTMLHTAQLYQETLKGEEIGLRVDGLGVDMAALQGYKNDVVGKLADGIGHLLQKQGVALYRGTGRLVAPHQVQVEGENTALLGAKRILLATGSAPVRLPIPGVELDGVFDSDGMLGQETLFPSLVIIGGGVIGMEFASLYSALGCQVTVIEALDRILANLDREFAQSLTMTLKRQGVTFHVAASLREIKRGEDGLTCHYTAKGQEGAVTAQAVLVAVGRRPVTDGLFAQGSAPAMERGRILVDGAGRTSLPHVWAIGDVTGGLQLAHVASAQGLNAVDDMLGRPPRMRLDVVPACVYVSPEIACVGLTAEEAKAKGIPVTTKKYAMSGNAKTVLTRQERSFLKVVLEEGTQVILGAQLMCGRATDMIGEFSSAIVNRLTLGQLAPAIRPHPTYNEAVWELFRD